MQIGFVGLLTLLFVGLKLTGVITWSWLWVFSPLWIAAIIGIVILILAICGFSVVSWFVSK